MPCVVGPYTNLNCTLRLLKHKFRKTAAAASAADYPEQTDGGDDERFATNGVPITAIAVSTGQNDSGVFDLNFRDERDIPFEGAGAISTWRLQLPDFRQFDFTTIADVVLTIRYTSLDGGDKLRSTAAQAVKKYVGDVEDLARDQGLFAVFDLKHDFASQWTKLVNPSTDEVAIPLDRLQERLPYFTKAKPWDPKKITATDIYLISPDGQGIPSIYHLLNGNDTTDFEVGKIGGLDCLAINDEVKLGDWKLVRDATDNAFAGSIWMLIRLVLK